MNNGDKPAMPTSAQPGGYHNPHNPHAIAAPITEGGMTKREAFAMAAMQGEIAGSAGGQRPAPGSAAQYAVECADALLAELDKPHGAKEE